jgi:hypothetical protein
MHKLAIQVQQNWISFYRNKRLKLLEAAYSCTVWETLGRLEAAMSWTSDGRDRGTGTFIERYSLLRFALRPFDDTTMVEASVTLSGY